MHKSDYPALRMRFDRGRLVPASQFDQERIDSYRNGATVLVRLTEERDRVLIRKWWAVLGLVLKQCQTPWKNKDEAHEAIKLALGIVNLSKTVGGDFMAYPKSLAELEDPELQEALEQMTELLSHMTGVDVATLRKETAHIDETPHDPTTGEIIDGEILPPETTESGASPAPENADADVPSSASAEEVDTAQPSASSTDPDASSSSEALDQAGDPSSSSQGSPAAISSADWLPTVARMLWAATHDRGDVEDNLALLNNQRLACNALDAEPPSEEDRNKAGSIYRVCKQVVMHTTKPADGKKIVASYAGVELGG